MPANRKEDRFLKDFSLHFCLCWVFAAVHSLALHCCAWTFSSWGLWASGCAGLSCEEHVLEGRWALAVVGCRLWVAALRISCSAVCGISVLGPWMEPMSPVLAGGFITTGPLEKFLRPTLFFLFLISHFIIIILVKNAYHPICTR